MKLDEILDIFIYEVFTYDARLWSYYMHEHEGLYAKRWWIRQALRETRKGVERWVPEAADAALCGGGSGRRADRGRWVAALCWLRKE